MTFRWSGMKGVLAALAMASTAAVAEPHGDEGSPDDRSWQGEEAPPPADDAYAAEDTPDAVDPGAAAEFGEALAPYGRWVEIPGYGQVWQPDERVVGTEFQPYGTGGHWVSTDYGWSFESSYAWGWAPFHYGRWTVQPSLGWVWVPGRVWAPAWVDWRFGGGYVGWAPLAPFGVRVDVEFAPHWCFVNTVNFVTPNVFAYRVTPERVHYALNVTQVIPQGGALHGTRFNAGPSPARIASAVGHPVSTVALRPPLPGRVQQLHLTSVPGRGVGYVSSPAPRLNSVGLQGGGRPAAHFAAPLPARNTSPAQRTAPHAFYRPAGDLPQPRTYVQNSFPGAARGEARARPGPTAAPHFAARPLGSFRRASAQPSYPARPPTASPNFAPQPAFAARPAFQPHLVTRSAPHFDAAHPVQPAGSAFGAGFANGRRAPTSQR